MCWGVAEYRKTGALLGSITELCGKGVLPETAGWSVMMRAMSAFSPVSLRSSDGISMCVCVCACVRNELVVFMTLAYPHVSSFHTMPVLYTSTHTHASSNHLGTANRQV